jgi:hypothetical protein
VNGKERDFGFYLAPEFAIDYLGQKSYMGANGMNHVSPTTFMLKLRPGIFTNIFGFYLGAYVTGGVGFASISTGYRYGNYYYNSYYNNHYSSGYYKEAYAYGFGAEIGHTKLRLRAEYDNIIIPSVSILAEPPVTVVNKNAEQKGTLNVSTEYLKYLYSKDGQTLAAKHYYRPSLPNLVEPKYLEIL